MITPIFNNKLINLEFIIYSYLIKMSVKSLGKIYIALENDSFN